MSDETESGYLRRIYTVLRGEPDDCQSNACECAGAWTDEQFFVRILDEIELREKFAQTGATLQDDTEKQVATLHKQLRRAQAEQKTVVPVLVVGGVEMTAADVAKFKASFVEANRLRNRVMELEAEIESFRLRIPNVPSGPSVSFCEVDQ